MSNQVTSWQPVVSVISILYCSLGPVLNIQSDISLQMLQREITNCEVEKVTYMYSK